MPAQNKKHPLFPFAFSFAGSFRGRRAALDCAFDRDQKNEMDPEEERQFGQDHPAKRINYWI
jgi:hypothetical protein